MFKLFLIQGVCNVLMIMRNSDVNVMLDEASVPCTDYHVWFSTSPKMYKPNVKSYNDSNFFDTNGMRRIQDNVQQRRQWHAGRSIRYEHRLSRMTFIVTYNRGILNASTVDVSKSICKVSFATVVHTKCTKIAGNRVSVWKTNCTCQTLQKLMQCIEGMFECMWTYR